MPKVCATTFQNGIVLVRKVFRRSKTQGFRVFLAVQQTQYEAANFGRLVITGTLLKALLLGYRWNRAEGSRRVEANTQHTDLAAGRSHELHRPTAQCCHRKAGIQLEREVG
jgi:hypothetical protein